MWWLIILTLHKSFIVCQIQSPQATWATDFYESTFQRCESTIHIIFNYVRAEQDHCLYNITGWRKWDSALLPRELTGSRWRAERCSRPRERCRSSRPLHNSLFHDGGRRQAIAGAGNGDGRMLEQGELHHGMRRQRKMGERCDCFHRFTTTALCCHILIKEEKN